MAVVDGGPAFPAEAALHNKGMTLRDWFAGQALAGMYAQFGAELSPSAFASFAYRLADAMLAARSREA